MLAVKASRPGSSSTSTTPAWSPAPDLQATLTALVVDPKGNGQEMTFSAAGCPDYIDTITAATGQGSKLCPPPRAVASSRPHRVRRWRRPPSPRRRRRSPVARRPPIEYRPVAVFGLTPEQLAALLLAGRPASRRSTRRIAHNRDFGLDAIVNLTLHPGRENAQRHQARRLLAAPHRPRPAAEQEPDAGRSGGPAGPRDSFLQPPG